QLSGRGAWFGAHPPEASRTVDVAAVGNEEQLRSVGRPGGREKVIPAAVVVTRQMAVTVRREPRDLRGAPCGERGEKDVPAALERRRDERDPLSVRGPARL